MRCAESLRVQAYFDGEVDAVAAADVERHAARCPECRALLEDLERTRSLVRRELPFEQAPHELRSRIMRLLENEAPARALPQGSVPRSPWRTQAFWLGAGSALGAALAAAVALFLLLPPAATPLVDQLIAAHVRSLMPAHLTDVLSTDQHTVKPWFAGHADVSPAVADFTSQGYRLVGGRADYLDGQRVAVTVYEHGPHVINVFTFVAGRLSFPNFTTRSGYHVAFWRMGDLEYCAVSDTGWHELKGLVRLLRGLEARGPGEAAGE